MFLYGSPPQDYVPQAMPIFDDERQMLANYTHIYSTLDRFIADDGLRNVVYNISQVIRYNLLTIKTYKGRPVPEDRTEAEAFITDVLKSECKLSSAKVDYIHYGTKTPLRGTDLYGYNFTDLMLIAEAFDVSPICLLSGMDFFDERRIKDGGNNTPKE
jgi:hypothetical protein